MNVLPKSILPSLLVVFAARNVRSITCPVPTTPTASSFAAIAFDYIIIGQLSAIGPFHILTDKTLCRWWHSWHRVIGQVEQIDFPVSHCLCPELAF